MEQWLYVLHCQIFIQNICFCFNLAVSLILLVTGSICTRNRYIILRKFPIDIFVFVFNRSILQGKTSHKFVDMTGNPIMKWYYTSKPVLFFMCAGNELFFASLYLCHFITGPMSMY